MDVFPVEAPTHTSLARHRLTLAVGAATTALAVAGVLFAVLKSSDADASQRHSLPYLAAIALVAGIAVFGWLVPNRVAARSTGLPLALVSIPLIVAYWSALPLIGGVAAVLVATAYRDGDGPHQRRALAATVIGVAVSLLTVAAIIFG